MSALYAFTWAGVLAALVLGSALWRSPPRPVEGLRQGALALAVVLLSAWGLARTADGRGAGFEVVSYSFEPSESPLTLGTGGGNDLVLLDGYAAPVHAAFRLVRDQGGLALSARSLTSERRMERNGVDVHAADLEVGSVLELDGEELVVQAISGPLPSITVSGPAGPETLHASFLRRLAAAIPGIGSRMEVAVGRLEPGFGARVLPTDLPWGDRPAAEIAFRGGRALLRFPSPADRDAHPLRVRRPGETEGVRPADREALLRDGDRITLGYSQYVLFLPPTGRAELRVVRGGARHPLPRGGDGLWMLGGAGAGPSLPWAADHPIPVLYQAGDDGSLRIASASPDAKFSDVRGELRLEPGRGPRTAELVPGSAGLLRLRSARSEVALRLRGAERPLALARGDDPSDPGTARWRAMLVLAALYLVGSLVLGFRGVLGAASGVFFHGLMLVFGQGLAGLSQLSVPGDPRLGGFVDKQALLGAVGMGATVLALLVLSFPRRRPEPRLHPFQWLGLPLGGRGAARGRAFALPGQPRIWIVFALACLFLLPQLPFGEQGVSLPGLGSVQPVEATKTCLLIFLAWFTVRALEDKDFRIRGGTEGLAARWGYMIHAVSLIAIVVLCFGLDDISPILIFGTFLMGMYYLSLSRPEMGIWPPRRLVQNFALEQFLMIAVLPPLLVWAALHHGGTVSRRFQVWTDPFLHTGDAGQFVTSLWTLVRAGIWGAGWGGRNGMLPPAVQDDFALAMLTAHTGLAGLVLLVATYAVALGAGVVAAARVAAERPDLPNDGTRERVQLLAVGAVMLVGIQLLVVLGSVTGWMPVMGQPLPFVAAGGSHLLLFCFPAVAFVLAASRRVDPRSARPFLGRVP